MYKIIILIFVFANIAHAQEQIKSKRNREMKRLTEITVIADPFNSSLLEHGSPVTVVDQEKLKITSESSLGETIAQEPGVSSSYFGPGSSRPIVRGNAGERVKVLKNGVGTLDASSFSEDHQVAVNPLNAQAVEILRGPETLLFGSQAIGGVVNVIESQIPEQAIGKVATGSLNFKTGNADNEVTTSALVEGQKADFNWHIDTFNQDTDDIEIRGNAESKRLLELEGEEADPEQDGRLNNSFSRSQGINIGNSMVKDWGFVGVSLSTTNSIYGVPGHAHEHELEHEHAHMDEHEENVHEEDEPGVAIDLEQVRVDLKGRVDKPFSGFQKLKFNVGGSNYDHQELEGKEVGTRYSNDALEGRLELTHNKYLGWDGVLGTQQEYSDFSAVGEEAFVPSTKRNANSIFAFEERDLNEYFRFQVGGRYEHVYLDPSGIQNKNFDPFGFSTGIVYDPTKYNDYTIGITASYTQRAPSSPELFANGAHIARQIFEVGDSSLEEEKSRGLDLTFKKNTGLITGSLNLFVQNFSDYINLSSAGAEEDGFSVYEYNNIRARLYGGEFEYALHLHELLGMWANDIDLYGQVDMVRGENKSNNDDLPRMPPVRTKVGLSYGWRDLFKAACEVQFVSAQNKVEDNELPTDSYSLLNAHITQKLPEFYKQNLSVFIRGTNLSDQEARIHTSFIKDLAPLRGRSILFGVESNF